MLFFLDWADILFEILMSLLFVGAICYTISNIVVSVFSGLIKLITKKTISTQAQRQVCTLISAYFTCYFAYDYCIDKHPLVASFVVLLTFIVFLVIFVKNRAKETNSTSNRDTKAKSSDLSNQEISKPAEPTAPSLASQQSTKHVAPAATVCRKPKTVSNGSKYIDPILHNLSYRFTTKKGDYVRSLGEQIVADKLFEAGITYDYGYVLHFDDAILRPSFKINYPDSNKQYFWEHFDTSADLHTRHEYLLKKDIYKKYNIVEGSNLIITTNNELDQMRRYRFIDNDYDCQTITSPEVTNNQTVNQPPVPIDKKQYISYSQYWYDTLSGDKVRSRDEVAIANMLYTAGIKYEYERLVQLGDIFLRPDFTIQISSTGEKIYWEHLGMLGDPEYRKKWKLKKETYRQHNVIEGANLIITNSTTSPDKLNCIIEDIRTHISTNKSSTKYDSNLYS